ncbi:protein-L-isoaspartate O-methyltransferase [Cristinia sonorae]|uniref:Protein-L-isoaspartate O-methyltransferase n=1 Tax=Cristinia sonorae TaxID=1940300 RepID=A0A8K0UTK2_9AGAR|nr:protein-L-isoaspartate O-methyltransferase [Cristinia sonorae]
MAWTCSGSTSAELIANMAKSGLIHSDRVAAAMKQVDRANYVLNKHHAYEDSPQPIGYEATISAPHMHAHAAENLQAFLKPGSNVLDVGSGSGYLSAVLHHLVGPSGKVVGIDHVPELVDRSVKNLKADGLGEQLASGSIVMIAGDGRQGYAEGAPYDAIHVGAAAPHMPQALVDQLASPGRMFIPVGDSQQAVYQVDKDQDGNVTQQRLFGVMYVPLTDRRQ